MPSGELQGRLWGTRARDWAELQEQSTLPLFSAVLDAAQITRGTRLLEAGCGAGLAALLAALRGAAVSAVDASENLLAVARERLPGADIRQADIETLPFGDASFDAVTAINSLFYAADMAAAARELARVAVPGGRVVVTAWGDPAACEFTAVIDRVRPLMPPPPPGAPAPVPLWEIGGLEQVLAGAGLEPLDRGAVECVFVYPNAQLAWQAERSAGVMQRAIETSGEAALRAALAEADAAHTQPDGSVRYRNQFVWAVGRKG